MKIILRISLAAVFSLLLSSCIDILHIVRINDAGDIDVTYRISVANMEGKQSGGGLSDEIPAGEMTELFKQAGIGDFSVENITGQYASSILMQFSSPPEFTSKTPPPLTPVWKGRELFLYPMNFPDSDSGESPEELTADEMAKSMMMSINYTLIFEKELYPDLGGLVTVNSAGEERACGYVDIGEYYIIDIPLGILLEDTGTALIFRPSGPKQQRKSAPKEQPGNNSLPGNESSGRKDRGGW